MLGMFLGLGKRGEYGLFKIGPKKENLWEIGGLANVQMLADRYCGLGAPFMGWRPYLLLGGHSASPDPIAQA